MLRYLVLAGLFYALTPGILLSVPKKASKNTVALTHAIIYAGAYYLAENLLGVRDGFQSGSGLMEVPAGADPTTVYNIQMNNWTVIGAQMEREASTNGTTTPLYLSLTAIRQQYENAARAAKYAIAAAANEAGSGSGRVAIAAPNYVALPTYVTREECEERMGGQWHANGECTDITGIAKPKPKPKPKPSAASKREDNPATSPGAIAGYVIAGVVVLVVFGGLGFYYAR